MNVKVDSRTNFQQVNRISKIFSWEYCLKFRGITSILILRILLARLVMSSKPQNTFFAFYSRRRAELLNIHKQKPTTLYICSWKFLRAPAMQMSGGWGGGGSGILWQVLCGHVNKRLLKQLVIHRFPSPSLELYTRTSLATFPSWQCLVFEETSGHGITWYLFKIAFFLPFSALAYENFLLSIAL